MNRAICEWLGWKPRRMWRVWWDEARQHGSIEIPSLEEAKARIDHEWQNNKRLGWAHYASEPEEYDEWSHLPSHITGIEALGNLHEAERELLAQSNIRDRDSLFARYFEALHAICREHHQNEDGSMVAEQWTQTATPHQRAIALLRTVRPELFQP